MQIVCYSCHVMFTEARSDLGASPWHSELCDCSTSNATITDRKLLQPSEIPQFGSSLQYAAILCLLKFNSHQEHVPQPPLLKMKTAHTKKQTNKKIQPPTPHKLEMNQHTKLYSMYHLNILINTVQTIYSKPPVSFKENYIFPETDLTHKFIITEFWTT